jgi:hypothetical protein
VDEVASVRELEILSVASWAFVREIRCNRKASHRGHGGHRGGFGVGGQNSIGDIVGVCTRNQVQQKSIAQGVTEATEGGLRAVVKNSIGDSVGALARNQVQGESIAQRSRREIGFDGQRFYQQQAGRFRRELIKRNGQSIVESYSGTRSMRKCKSPHRKER